MRLLTIIELHFIYSNSKSSRLLVTPHIYEQYSKGCFDLWDVEVMAISIWNVFTSPKWKFHLFYKLDKFKTCVYAIWGDLNRASSNKVGGDSVFGYSLRNSVYFGKRFTLILQVQKLMTTVVSFACGYIRAAGGTPSQYWHDLYWKKFRHQPDPNKSHFHQNEINK